MKYSYSATTVAAGLLVAAGGADAFWRMPCRSRTGLARMDPIMDPGEISDHVHTIHGGGNFGFNTTSQDLMASDCTSCEVTQDKSAYWTPSLHFLYPNGTSVIVPQIGGMLAYYLLYTDSANPNGNITAFPDGFQMISGDKTLRNFSDYPVPDPPKSSWAGTDLATQPALAQHAIGFNCLNYNAAPEGSLYRHFLPEKSFLDSQCTDGLRLELMFPSCWNGKDLDSPNHRDHVAFPDQVMTGNCPEGFPIKLPSLFFETIWNTYAFAGVDGQFVLSTGDPTGYGYHGDFIVGWEGGADFLQSAVDQCTNLSGLIQDCPLFNIQDDSTAAQCTFDEPEILSNDNPAGPRNGLALDVPIQSGPEPATAYPIVTYGQAAPSSYAATTSTSAAAVTSSAIVPTLSYSAAATGTTVDNIILKQNQVQVQVATQSADASTAPSTTVSVSEATITPSASLSDAAGSILSTTYITSASEVVEMVIEQVLVTVTAGAPSSTLAPAKLRRHMDSHSRQMLSRKEKKMHRR